MLEARSSEPLVLSALSSTATIQPGDLTRSEAIFWPDRGTPYGMPAADPCGRDGPVWRRTAGAARRQAARAVHRLGHSPISGSRAKTTPGGRINSGGRATATPRP